VNVSLEGIPLEKRADAAIRLIEAGADPFDMLAAVVFGTHTTTLDKSNHYGGYCPHGHPWNEANTYIRKNGWRVCRACNNENRSRYADNSKKVPCHYCGTPCQRSKKPGGVPRCWTCYTGQVREEDAA
jgi:hypothetical protein